MRYTGLALLGLLLAACETRSISASGPNAARYSVDELEEMEVLGLKEEGSITEQEIEEALADQTPVTLRLGDRLMVVQSGADLPDAEMQAALASVYDITPLSGRDRDYGSTANSERHQFNRALRLAAARGGIESVLVYWGVLESGYEDYATRAVSWAPVVGWIVPDRKQHMRIKIKAALIDVRTGRWTMFYPTSSMATATSSPLNRDEKDQELVARLKAEAYTALAAELKAYSQTVAIHENSPTAALSR